jgi:hypothetical protein
MKLILENFPLFHPHVSVNLSQGDYLKQSFRWGFLGYKQSSSVYNLGGTLGELLELVGELS